MSHVRLRHASVLGVAGALALLVVTPSAPAGSAGRVGDLTPSATVPVGDTPQAAVVADFDTDGHVDLATANRLGLNVSVALGDGAGGFGDAVEYGGVFDPADLAAGDVNGDGVLDLVVLDDEGILVNQSGTLDDVKTLLGNGDGTFDPPVVGALFGPAPGDLLLDELTGDGVLDVAITNRKVLGDQTQLSFEIYRGRGDGTFAFLAQHLDHQQAATSAGHTPYDIASGDLDGDADPDLVVANSLSDTASVWLGNGSGEFERAPGDPIPLLGNAGGIVVADYDEDGDLDLAMPQFSGFKVALFDNDGALGFSRRQVTFAGPVESLAPADVNDDGDLDLVTGALNSSNAYVLLGDGAGGFVTGWGSTHPVGTSYAVVAADFDEDGLDDAAWVNGSADAVGVWRSVIDRDPPAATITPTPGIPDGDDGWYVSAPTLVVTAADTGPLDLPGIDELRCTLDPPVPPTAFTDLSGGCPTGSATGEITVAADGDHTAYAAARDASGNVSEVAAATVRVDLTDPTLAPVVSPPNPVQGTTATADPTAQDATSGVATSGCDPVDTSVAGTHTVECRATDVAGNEAVVHAAYTVVAADHRPDLLVRKPGGAWVGAGRYGAADTQTVFQAIRRAGATVTAYVRVENDGNRAEKIRVRGAAGTTTFRVAYFAGTTRITGAVLDGTWQSPVLEPEGAVVLQVVVTRTRAAQVGDRRTFWVRGRSATEGVRRDAVATVVTARR